MSPALASPVAAGTATPDVWIAAQGAMAADLATFQATKPKARSQSFDDVIEAMGPAFDLGFAYSLKTAAAELTVTLMHRGGWDMASTGPVETGAGLLLADLLGIRVHDAVAIAQQQQDQPEPVCPMPGPTKAWTAEQLASELPALNALTSTQGDQPEPEPACPMPTPKPAQAAVPFEVADEVDEFAEDSIPAELLVELSESDRKTCVAMVKALKPDERKSFTVAFRSHFKVPSSEPSIGKLITQVQHQRFVQSFIDELELQSIGVAA